MILPRRPFFISYSDLLSPGIHSSPPSSVSVSVGQYIQMPNGSFAVCTFSGDIGPTLNTAVLTPLAGGLPSGNSYFVATTAGTTGPPYLIPPFNAGLHATTSDGTWSGPRWDQAIFRPAGFRVKCGQQAISLRIAACRAWNIWRPWCEPGCCTGRAASRSVLIATMGAGSPVDPQDRDAA